MKNEKQEIYLIRSCKKNKLLKIIVQNNQEYKIWIMNDLKNRQINQYHSQLMKEKFVIIYEIQRLKEYKNKT